MRKILLLLVLLSLGTSFAQSEKKTIFGFKGGLNKSYIVGDSKDYYTGLELYGGFFSESEFKKGLYLQNELLFSYTDDIHFIEIPILIKFNFKTNWKLMIGPKLDFIADNDNDDFEAGYQFKNFGVSAVIGIEFKISKLLFSELRLSQSFTEQIDDLVLELYNSKRRTIRLGLGIKF